eukprot:492994_1
MEHKRIVLDEFDGKNVPLHCLFFFGYLFKYFFSPFFCELSTVFHIFLFNQDFCFSLKINIKNYHFSLLFVLFFFFFFLNLLLLCFKYYLNYLNLSNYFNIC